jgi:hypothetical protein
MRKTIPLQRINLKVPAITLALLSSIHFVNAQDWHLAGNGGTTPGTHFLGTTDAKVLMLKVNNQKSGYIDFDVVKANTSFGFQALLNNSTGTSNTAFGYHSLYSNLYGDYNTASGYKALYSNIEGDFNTASGYYALYSNTYGNYNMASGPYALYSNIGGNYNTASGMNALYQNTYGEYNTAAGYAALNNNTLGHDNTAAGARALVSNTTGNFNTASGSYALRSNTSGNDNTAAGYQTLYFNTTGHDNTASGYLALSRNTTGNYNTASGAYALDLNTTGTFNTATGYNALLFNTTGYNNTASGVYALYHNTTGIYNTASGYDALYSNTTGNFNTASGLSAGSYNDNNTYCTFVGYDADQVVTTDFTNSMALGNTSRITASNQVRIGNSSVTSIGGYVGWTDLPSDARFKKNIKNNVPGLVFINQLQPITYTVDVTKLRKFFGEDKNTNGADETSAVQQNGSTTAIIQNGIAEKEMMVRTGFIAQQVEAAAKKINYNFSGVDKPKDDNGIYGLRYAEFVVPLVKAVQELSKMNDEKEEKIAEQDRKLGSLQKEIDELRQQVQGLLNNGITTSLQSIKPAKGAGLQQNTPNPFSQNTTIHYTIPPGVQAAQIAVYNSDGKQLKMYTISNSGNNTITISAGTLAAGTYNYALLIEGKVIDSKSMVITR